MDQDTFNNKIKEIGELETVEEMRAELAEVSNSINDLYNSNTTLSEQHENDLKEMEAIRQANMKLFQQIGTDKTPAQATEEQTGLKQEPVERRKFENLFDDKGNFIKN